MFRWLLLIAIVAACGADFGAVKQGLADGGLHLHIDSVEASSFPKLQATVTVTDDSGRPVAGVPPEAFTAHLGASVLPASAVAASSDAHLPITVVLAIDTSGSMAGVPLDDAKQAAISLVTQLAPEDGAGLVAFAGDVNSVPPTAGDSAAIAAAINGLSAGGTTALYDAVAQSAELLKAAGTPRKAIVLLSDGQEYGVVSQTGRAGSLAAAQSANAPVFAVGLGQSVDQEYLQNLAQATRGQLLLAPDPGVLAGLYTTIASILRLQYVLTLDATGLDVTDPSLRIDVSVQGLSAFGQASVSLPAALTIQPVTPSAAPATAVPQAVPDEAGGGVPVLLIVAAAAGGLAIGGVGFAFWRRRRRRDAGEPEVGESPQPAGQPGPIEVPVAEARASTGVQEAWLRLPGPEGEKVYRIGESPVTIGFGPDCDLRMPDAGANRGERARIWPRDGRFMLHSLSMMGQVTVSGRPAGWVVLEEGDDIQLGQYHLLFTTEPQQPADANSNSFL